MGTRLPAIPDISNSAIPLEVKRAIMALAARSVIREAEGPRSDPLDKVMTFRDAQTLSLVAKSGSGFVASAAPAISAAVEIVEAAGGGSDVDLTIPPAVASLAVVGGYSTAFITFDQPSYTKSGSSESNHAYTEIYRADANGDGSSPGFAASIAVAQTQGAFVPDAIGGFGQKYFYWARNVSRADVPGPVAGGVSGVSVTMPVQVDVYMDALDAATGPFVTYASPTVVNGQTLPAGTYMRNAFIQYGVIGSLHVDLTTANRLYAVDGTFGTVVADTVKVLNANIAGVIQSSTYASGSAGWRIDKDGGAEFNDVTVRGEILGGGATAYATGTGFFAGDDAGTYKIRGGNPAGARFQWTGTSFDVYNAANEQVISAGDIVKLKDATEVVNTEHVVDNAVSREVYAFTASQSSDTYSGSGDDGKTVAMQTATLADTDVAECIVSCDLIFQVAGGIDTALVDLRLVSPSSTVLWSETMALSLKEASFRAKGTEQGTYTLQAVLHQPTISGVPSPSTPYTLLFRNRGVLIQALKK